MASWVKGYLNAMGGAVSWLFHWGTSAAPNWVGWVNSTLRRVVAFSYRSYTVLTNDLGNLSYYTASFAQTARKWIWWVAYEVVPAAQAAAQAYADKRFHELKDWTRAELAKLRAELLDDLSYVYNLLNKKIDKEIADRIAAVASLQAFLVKLIIQLDTKLTGMILAERAARRREVHALRVWTKQQLANLWAYARSIIPAVDKEAADGYNSTRTDQAGILGKLIDDLAIDNPIVKDAVSKLAGIVIDIASIDDPLLRVAAQFIVTQVIDRLGLDKIAAGLVSDLLHTFLGAGPPKTLGDVTASIGDRLNSTEAQWQQFFASGGDDLESLGNQMRASSNPLFTAAMAAWFISSVADPEGTAAANDAILTPAVEAIITPLTALLGV